MCFEENKRKSIKKKVTDPAKIAISFASSPKLYALNLSQNEETGTQNIVFKNLLFLSVVLCYNYSYSSCR
jgi:hypothetical protein